MIGMKTNRKLERLMLDDVIYEVKKCCNQYNYDCVQKDNRIHIYSRYEAWYFTFNMDNQVVLYHGSSMGRYPKSYHKQFTRRISIKELVEYINQHENYRYLNCEREFVFDTDGNVLGLNELLPQKKIFEYMYRGKRESKRTRRFA